jgi:hypothetical protein
MQRRAMKNLPTSFVMTVMLASPDARTSASAAAGVIAAAQATATATSASRLVRDRARLSLM